MQSDDVDTGETCAAGKGQIKRGGAAPGKRASLVLRVEGIEHCLEETTRPGGGSATFSVPPNSCVVLDRMSKATLCHIRRCLWYDAHSTGGALCVILRGFLHTAPYC